MTKKEIMLAIEAGLQNLLELSPQSVDYYNSIVYNQRDKLISSRCTAQILKQIEDDVMQLTREG